MTIFLHMKIHSDFKDYYDAVLKVLGGDDDGIDYVRKTETIDFKDKDFTVKIPRGYRDRYFKYENIKVIGFCGKIYYSCYVGSNLFVGLDDEKIIEQAPEYYDEKRRNFDSFLIREIGQLVNYDFKPDDFWGKNVTLHHPFNFEEFFVKYSVPCFVFELKYRENERERMNWLQRYTYSLILNPCLKDYSFQRVMDPNTALQELRMYFSSVMTSKMNAKMPVGDDQVLAASKGFDKWSFRKMPTKRKAQ